MLDYCDGSKSDRRAARLLASGAVLQLVIFLRILLVESCEFTFSSAKSESGNFSSPGYPGMYPLLAACRYVFQGTEDERIRITYSEFDLESGTDAGCLFDYIDTFTIDVDQMKNLESRICGQEIPRPFVSIHSRVELVFKSDYAGPRKGFFGQYDFLNEHWQPFPPSSPGCGDSFLTGVGGEITSPGYPDVFPPDVHCTWTIRVDHGKKIILNFIEFKLSQSVHCESTFVTIYNGFSSPTSVPTEKICTSHVKKEFRSKSYRVIVRFQSGGKSEHHNVGFRIAWTAVWAPKEIEDKDGNYIGDHCDGFHCTGGEYCIDTSRLLCNPLQHYCISESLRCNRIPNCGAHDDSDEEGCFSRTFLMVTVSSVVCSVLLSILLVILCLRRRQRILERRRRRRRSSSSSSLRPPDKTSSAADILTCWPGSSLRSHAAGGPSPADRSPKRTDSLSPSSTNITDPMHKTGLTRPPGSTCYNINGTMPPTTGSAAATAAALRAITPHLVRPQQQMDVHLMYYTDTDQCTVVPDAGVNYLPGRDLHDDQLPRNATGSEWRLVRACSRSRSSDGGMHLTGGGGGGGGGGRYVDALHLDEGAAGKGAMTQQGHSSRHRVRYPSTGTLHASSHQAIQYDHRFYLSSDCLNPDRIHKVNTMSSIV